MELALLALDVLVIFAAFIFSILAYRLYRSLSVVRESKAELEQLSQQFIQATDSAEKSIVNLKAVADPAAESLQTHIDKALKLRDELDFLVERADQLADSLSDGISSKRKSNTATKNKNSLEEALKDMEKKADKWEEESKKEGSDEDDDLRRSLKGVR